MRNKAQNKSPSKKQDEKEKKAKMFLGMRHTLEDPNYNRVRGLSNVSHLIAHIQSNLCFIVCYCILFFFKERLFLFSCFYPFYPFFQIYN